MSIFGDKRKGIPMINTPRAASSEKSTPSLPLPLKTPNKTAPFGFEAALK